MMDGNTTQNEQIPYIVVRKLICVEYIATSTAYSYAIRIILVFIYNLMPRVER